MEGMSAAVNVLSLDSDWVFRVIKGKVGDCVYQNSKPSFLAHDMLQRKVNIMVCAWLLHKQKEAETSSTAGLCWEGGNIAA